jgi:hypothetical protein
VPANSSNHPTPPSENSMPPNKRPSHSVTGQRLKRRLSENSLVSALSRIDPADEPSWFKVACILASSLGEAGRGHFLRFSEGHYWSELYCDFSQHEANKKFDRALRETGGREKVAGVRALLKMAGLKINEVTFENTTDKKDHEPDQEIRARELLQRDYALIILGGQIRVIKNEEIELMRANRLLRGVSLYQKRDAELMMRRSLSANGFAQSSNVIANFFIDPQTTVFEETAFHPLEQPTNVLNYWRSPVAAISGKDISEIIYFLCNVICAGDRSASEYLLNFLAHMLQKPEEKPGIIIVLMGGQGVGKGTLFKLLQAIWKGSVMLVQDIDHVVGRFNSGLERCFISCMDEAIFRGDRKASERLKALITEPFFRIEEKYEPARTIQSFHRFFAATNSNHFGQVDIDDRRYLFLRVSDQKRCDHDYFRRLNDLFADEKVIGAFVHSLYQRDLKGVNIFARPQATEHVIQRVKSLTGFARFWHDFLVREGVGIDGSFLSTDALLTDYGNYNSREERYFPLQSNELSRNIAEMCPSATKTRRAEAGGFSPRGYNFPPLSVCRREFENYVGDELDWDTFPGEQSKYSSPF